MNDSEKLIPVAIAEIRAELRRQGEERHDGPYVDGQGADEFASVDGWVSLAQVARVALTVFEKAHTPTDDERQAGWSHPDAVYSPEVFAAIQDLLNEAKGSPTHALRLAVSRQISEPSTEVPGEWTSGRGKDL